MPRDVLGNIPNGADVFLDANVFVYALGGISADCRTFLDRCSRQEVFGITSFEVIHELTHRLMVSEAFRKGLIAKPRADMLRQKPDAIKQLKDYWAQASSVMQLALAIVGTEDVLVGRAQDLRDTYGLMTLDSVIVATMHEYGISNLASHDGDFERVDTVTVYHPTDIP